ncbi:MAG: DUF4406 domain-containing protein [Ignavibacteria bacterium]|jgi:hypothetical protein|nr:DUF4406 domain-containing protein [Ignavibacteria bacterium]
MPPKQRYFIAGELYGKPLSVLMDRYEFSTIYLQMQGFEPINPMELILDYRAYFWVDMFLEVYLPALEKCDGLYLQKGWEETVLARIAHYISTEILRIPIIFEDSVLN